MLELGPRNSLGWILTPPCILRRSRVAWLVKPVGMREAWNIYFSDYVHLFHQFDYWYGHGFHGSSNGKESACNAGDPSSIPGSGRATGKGIGYSLQYSWASLMAQLVKNLPAMQETWIWSLGWEDPLAKGTATHTSILAWRIPWTVQSMGLQRVGHHWVTHFHFHNCTVVPSYLRGINSRTFTEY